MLPTEHRLRRREDFATAVRRGRRAGRPLLVVHCRSGATDPHAAGGSVPPARAGFVVSKAVGGAVVRTKVKRRLRHLVRDRLDRLPAGSLVVVRALPGAGAAEYDQLARDLDAALERLLGGAPKGCNPTGAVTDGGRAAGPGKPGRDPGGSAQ
ncbi:MULTISPECIES: ribonuclease P protein component [Streptomyces]|uniref:Ribonuclease P protein component n=1 Tax=Streptomyces yunnanensis TaxID=156453 RepID=A0ABY8ACB9_9ACTN|nr:MULTISPECIES: ribonuclease P protein component [Streptomyces]MCZ0994420.1 ribonuclease P protein component [Streptomyces noursei]MCZ1016888.1 ribonuclease P protein component [Streptomyces noursei]QRX93228.1 ribonuclease P protein component [Streptomyces noursei]UJB42940.1 ribonuclease P protein component [Streptomyces sp. A1-5]WEB41580.1 ribonuclease P protein component [Streptomyces yunnanensis]